MSSSARTVSPVAVLVAPIRSTMIWWLDQQPASPVQGDLGELPVFDLVPFAGSRWEVADGDRQAGLGGEAGEFNLPSPDPVAVGAATVHAGPMVDVMRLSSIPQGGGPAG